MGMDFKPRRTSTHPVTYITKNLQIRPLQDEETWRAVTIDYDEMLEVAKKEKPKIILAGFSAYPRAGLRQNEGDCQSRRHGCRHGALPGLIAGKALRIIRLMTDLM